MERGGTGPVSISAGAAPSAGALARLMAVNQVLYSMDDMGRVADFCHGVLLDLPGVAKAGVCLETRGFEPEADPAAGVSCDFCAAGTEPSQCPVRPLIECLNDNRYLILPLETPNRRFGAMGIEIGEANAFAPYESFVRGIAATIGLVAETIWARRRLSRDNNRLRDELLSRLSELEESEGRFSDVFHNAPVGMMVCGRGGRAVRANQTFADMLGYGSGDLLGKSLGELRHPDDGDIFEDWLKAVLSRGGAPSRAEFRMTGKDGRVVWTEAIATLRGNAKGGGPYIIVQALDISARKREEESRRNRSRDLEKRVRLRTRRFEEVRDELEEFAYAVAHELRAPLRAIDGFGKALSEENQSRLDSRGQWYVGRIRANCASMAGLIDDLLNLLKLARTEMAAEPLCLGALARGVAETLRNAEPERPAEFDIQPDLKAFGDRRLLRTALGNLLGNAWKFTRGRDPARIAFGCRMEDGEPVYFVRDNGIGFDPVHAERMFHPFRRLRADLGFEGAGTGLAAAERIIRRHGGRMWAESRPGEGSVFYFTLGRNPRDYHDITDDTAG